MNLELNAISLAIQAQADGNQLTADDKQALKAELARLTAFWPHLTPDEKAALLADGTVDTQIENNNNQYSRGGIYRGRSEMRRVYVHVLTDEVIASESDWRTVFPPADQVRNLLVYGVQTSPEAYAALLEINGGNLPEILPPKPEPVIEEIQPDPDQLGPVIEPPVEPEEPGNTE